MDAWTPFEEEEQDRDLPSGERFRLFHNNVYTVLKRELPAMRGWPKLIHLSIRRNDRKPIDDWRDKQRIKNLIVGPEHEGVELFPAEGRLVDTANQFHMFIIADPGVRFPFGYQERLVSEDLSVQVAGNGISQQRPFTDDNRPDDLLTADELKEMLRIANDRKANTGTA
jgi:hypothetical protein